MISSYLRSAIAIVVFVATCFFATSSIAQEVKEFYPLWSKAETLRESGKYKEALAVYRDIEQLNYLSAPTMRVLRFRIEDSTWRSSLKTNPAAAADAIQHLIPLIVKPKLFGGDRVGAEIRESVADYFWMRPAKEADWTRAWPQYKTALYWWLSAEDLPEANRRYLDILFKAATPPWFANNYVYGQFSNWIPLELLEHGVDIAQTPAEKGTLLSLKAKTLAVNDFGENEKLTFDTFEAALALGAKNPLRASTLFDFAQYLDRSGAYFEGSKRRPEVSRIHALELYDQVVREFGRSGSPVVEQARKLSEVLRRPFLRIVTTDLVPGEPLTVTVAWANMPSVRFGLFSVNLLDGLALNTKDSIQNDWFNSSTKWYDLITQDKLKYVSALEAPAKSDPHFPAKKNFEFKKALAPGAYILEAKTSSGVTRQLFSVSQMRLALSNSDKTVKVLASDTTTGAPRINVNVKLWEKHSFGLDGYVEQHSAQTDFNGIATFALSKNPPSQFQQLFDKSLAHVFQLLAVAESDGHQAYVADASSLMGSPEALPWFSYIFTDRPVYCAGEEVKWRILVSKPDLLWRAEDRFALDLVFPGGKRLAAKPFPVDEFLRSSGFVKTDMRWPSGIYTLHFEHGEGEFVGSREFLVRKGCKP